MSNESQDNQIDEVVSDDIETEIESTAQTSAPMQTAKSDAKPAGVLYVGIDLGTSRTSVSASNGVRETVASFVGYPKDPVARKLLKRDVLFGDDALENRLALNLFRPLEHGVLKCSDESGDDSGNLKAAKDLIAEIIRKAKPRKDELVYGVIGCPAQVSINNRQAILDAARETVDSVMLCSEPFSVAYGLDMLDDVLVIDIGAGTTDLCRMHGTMPDDADQITLTHAGDWIDKEFTRLLEETIPEAQYSVHMIKSIKERYANVGENVDPVIVELPVDGKPTKFDVTSQLRQACQGIVGPIVDGLSELVSTFDPEFQDRLKQRVLLGGGGSQIRGLDWAIEQEMEKRLGSGGVKRTEEPMYGGSNGALKVAHDMPADYWEQLK